MLFHILINVLALIGLTTVILKAYLYITKQVIIPIGFELVKQPSNKKLKYVATR